LFSVVLGASLLMKEASVRKEEEGKERRKENAPGVRLVSSLLHQQNRTATATTTPRQPSTLSSSHDTNSNSDGSTHTAVEAETLGAGARGSDVTGLAADEAATTGEGEGHF
jgi:hypothetical protein